MGVTQLPPTGDFSGVDLANHGTEISFSSSIAPANQIRPDRSPDTGSGVPRCRGPWRQCGWRPLRHGVICSGGGDQQGDSRPGRRIRPCRARARRCGRGDSGSLQTHAPFHLIPHDTVPKNVSASPIISRRSGTGAIPRIRKQAHLPSDQHRHSRAGRALVR